MVREGIHCDYNNKRGWIRWGGKYPSLNDPFFAFLLDALGAPFLEFFLSEVGQHRVFLFPDLHRYNRTSAAKLATFTFKFLTIFSASFLTVLPLSSAFLFFFSRHC